MELNRGDAIEVTDALGRTIRKRAISGIETGGSFPVVWACSEDEWSEAEAAGREPDPDPFPWPLEDVKVLTAEAVGG